MTPSDDSPKDSSAAPAAQSAGRERRNSDRIPFRSLVEVKIPTWQAFRSVHAVNVSQGGMRISLGPHARVGLPVDIILTLPNGKRAVFAGGKNADVYALDPDQNGKLLFHVNPLGATPGTFGRGGRGSIVWGGATDGQRVYYGTGAGGLAAINAEGGSVWQFTAAGLGGRGNAGLGAAPTSIPGVVFEGATDGQLFAVSAAEGKQLWQFNTAQTFDTVNKVPAHGGAINTSGAVVVDGMVFVGSGYAISAGASGGNVLLAFGLE